MKEETKEAFWFLKFVHSIHITASIVLFSYQRLLNAKNFSHFKKTFLLFLADSDNLLSNSNSNSSNRQIVSNHPSWQNEKELDQKKLNRKWMFNMLRHLLNFSSCSRKMKKSYFLLENEKLSAWFISWTFPSATVAYMRHLFS